MSARTRRAGGRSRRWARHALLAAALLAPLVVPVSAADAAGMQVFPPDTVRDRLTLFAISGTARATVYDVRFNGTFVGRVAGDVDGGFYSGSFQVPPAGDPGAPVCGTNTVTLVETSTGALADSGTLRAYCPRLAVSPQETSGVRATAYRVTPVDFPPDDFVVGLSVDGVATDVRADGGDLLFTGSLPCGAHQVRLVEREGGTHDGPVPDDVATTTTRVMCPAVTLAPGSVRSAAQPTTVAVRATGYHGGRPVTVAVDGVTATTSISDLDGVVATTMAVAELACGGHTVTVTEQPPAPSTAPLLLTAGAPLTVTGCTPGAPRVALDPAVLRTGMLTHVTGSGFTAGSPVTLTWRTPDGAALPGDCTTTADPTGRIDTYCPVLPHGVLGARRLHATQGTRTAAADAVVDGGSMQPGVGGDQLVFRR